MLNHYMAEVLTDATEDEPFGGYVTTVFTYADSTEEAERKLLRQLDREDVHLSDIVDVTYG